MILSTNAEKTEASKEKRYFLFLGFLSNRFLGSFGFRMRLASVTLKLDPLKVCCALPY
jgi:hypothetical protein